MPKSDNVSARKRVTIRDVAADCGVSRQVVSLVVAGKESASIRYSSETRDRVLEAVKRLGYRPNRTVQSFNKQRHGVIGVLGHSIHYIPPLSLETMLHTARRHAMMLTLEQIGVGKMPRMIAEDCVDGLILFQTVDDKLTSEIQRVNQPVIQVNTNVRFGPGCLTYDDETAAREAAALFHAKGRRHPVIVTPRRGSAGHYSNGTRRQVFTDACRELGMAEPLIATADHEFDDFQPQARLNAFFHEHPQIDCALPLVDTLVPAVYDAAAATGRRIPDDLAVLTWNDTALTRGMRPAVSTFYMDHRQVGITAIEMMIHRLNDAKQPDGVVMPFTLHEREST